MSRTSIGIVLMAGFFAVINNANALDNSMIIRQNEAGENIFKRIHGQAEKDPSKTLIEHIVTDSKTDQELWRPLAELGLVSGKITPADLLFVIKEFSMPYIITDKNQAQALFTDLIIGRLKNPKKSTEIIKLLTEASIAHENNQFFGNKPKEMRNVMVECVENGFTEALGAMLNAWPSNSCDLHRLPALILTERVFDLEGSGFFFNAYKDGEKKNLNLVEWLIRDDGSSYTYMIGRYKNHHYVKAALHLLSYVQNRRESEIKGDMINLAEVLERQDELPKMLSFHHLIRRAKDLDGVNWKAIPADQGERIKREFNTKIANK